MTSFSSIKDKNFHQKKFRKIMTFSKEDNSAISISPSGTLGKKYFDSLFLSIFKVHLLKPKTISP